METVSNPDSGVDHNTIDEPVSGVQQRTIYQDTGLSPDQREALSKALQQIPAFKTAQHVVTRQPVLEQQQNNIPQHSPSINERQHPVTHGKQKRTTRNFLLALLLMILLAGAGLGGWYYWWTTYTVFEYRLSPVVILQGQSVEAGDFLYPGEDMEHVSASFRSQGYRQTEGRQNVPLMLKMGWRTVDAVATLVILRPVENIYHEFASAGPELKPEDFITNADTAAGIHFDIRFTTEPLLLEDYPVGVSTLHLALNDTSFEVSLTVTDTTSPAATAVDRTIRIGEDVTPDDFITGIFDASPIKSVTFANKPDVYSHRDQIVEVIVEDIYGNTGVFVSSLTILLNTSPPVIEGTETIVSMVGNPILYRRGVRAFDSFNRELDFEVDSSRVDQDTEGDYTVVYWTVDRTGLRSEVEISVHILDVDMEFVNEEVDKALRSIIKDDMTQLEMVRAIYDWVRRNVQYANVRGGPTTAYEGAYRALRDRRGNCYIFYSISELLLTRAGVPNMLIQRIPGTPTNHRWNLVNPDGLGWHHYDSFPTRLQMGITMSYFTSSQAQEFTLLMAEMQERPMPNYFTYDPALYPEIVW